MITTAITAASDSMIFGCSRTYDTGMEIVSIQEVQTDTGEENTESSQAVVQTQTIEPTYPGGYSEWLMIDGYLFMGVKIFG